MSQANFHQTSTNNHQRTVDKFSISSLLWRAGWSPSGLLQFRKDPVPATLLSTLERPPGGNNNNKNHNHNTNNNHSETTGGGSQPMMDGNNSSSGLVGDNNKEGNNVVVTTAQNFRTVGISLNIPLNASIRCGGMLMENFETGHASLAPFGAYHHSTASSSSSTNQKTLTRSTTNICSPSPSSSSKEDLNQIVPSSSSSPPPSPTINNTQASDFLENQFNDDILLSSRCKITVESDGSFDTDFYVTNDVKSAPSVSGGGSWFGGNSGEDSLNEIDGMIFTIKVQIWNAPLVSSSEKEKEKDKQSTTTKRHIIGSFKVTRVWKEIKRIATLLHELHPELLLPLFSYLDSFNSNLMSSQTNSNNFQHEETHFFFSTNSDLEVRLDMLKSLIASFQRNSAFSTHSPVIVMFLLEEDHSNFYKFLSTMEQQLKAQGEERGSKLQQATEYRRLKEEGISSSSSTNNIPNKKKDKEKEGFFSSWFGGDSDSKKKSNKDGKSHNRTASTGSTSAAAINHFPQTIVNMIPHTPEQIQEAETRVSTARFVVEDLTSELIKWQDAHNSFVALDTSVRRMLAMSRFHQDEVRDYTDVLVEYTNEIVGTNRNRVSFLRNLENNVVTSSSSPPSSIQHNPLAGDHQNNNNIENDHRTLQENFTSSLAQVEVETKSNLRMAVMIMGSRAEALQGGENMLSALSQSSKSCLMISKSIVSFLQQHRILAERASQLSFINQVDSENLLDFVVHIVRPISIEEIDVAKKAMRVQEHTMSVLFYSLSRQYCDTVLRCCATLQSESAMMQEEQEDQLGWTISLGSPAASGALPDDVS